MYRRLSNFRYLRYLLLIDIGVSRDAIIESLSVANIKADVATGGKEAVAKMRAAAETVRLTTYLF